ncbi:hypothetical protein V2J09_020004 [Rumex salicifolius]
MGESESSMDAPISYNPMEDSDETLEVSVSFGRFENDLLAWEKWSTFPSNKYLEEVEKCSTPGSVAQKKAYFEAHYKRIAARKAEQEEQDKKEGDGARDPVDSEAQPQTDLVAKFCEAEDSEVQPQNDQGAVSGIELDNEVANSENEMISDRNNVDDPKEIIDTVNESKDLITLLDTEKLNEQNYVSGIELESEVIISETESLDMANERKDTVPLLDAEKLNEMNCVGEIELGNDVTDLASEMRSDQVHEPKNSLDMINKSKNLMPLIDAVKDESCSGLASEELDGSEEPALVKDNAPTPCSKGVEEVPKHINAKEIVSVDKEQKDKSDKVLKSKKATTMKMAMTNTTPLKKKPAGSTPKSSLLSTPKLSRSALSKSTMSESKGVSKKEYGTSPLINRKTSRTDSRRAAPTSLHMSLRLSADLPANSEAAPSTTMRKSVFMEKMGDKDIVKRAFKAFRNDLHQLPSSSPGKPTLANQEKKIPGKETSMKASVVGTPQKKIGGVKNVVKKTPQSSQSGLRKTSNSTRLPHTAVSADQRNVKSVSSPYGLRSRDKPDKRNELSKKLEEKANGKAAERTQSQSEVKV